MSFDLVVRPYIEDEDSIPEDAPERDPKTWHKIGSYDSVLEAIRDAAGDFTKYEGGELVIIDRKTGDMMKPDDITNSATRWRDRNKVIAQEDAIATLYAHIATMFGQTKEADLKEIEQFAEKFNLPFDAKNFLLFEALFRVYNPYWDSSSASC